MARLAALVLVVITIPAFADTFGPVTVEVREGVAPIRDGTYFEHRFTVFNPTADPHVVRISLLAAIGGNEGRRRAARTVAVAPRSSAVVSIPEYVLSEYYGARAEIAVDGNTLGTLDAASFGSSYRSARDVLFGRTVPAGAVPQLAPAENIGVAVRPQVPPSSWSSNWLHYTPFIGAVLTARDWNELPRPVQAALLRWVSAGGSLTFIGNVGNLPPLRPVDATEATLGYLGFGWIVLLPENPDIPKVAARVQSTWRQADLDTRYMWYGSMHDAMPVPLLDDPSLPLKSLFSLLVVFAVVGGPVNLWVLAKKQRRLWVFWTLPVLAVITALILVGALIVNEGWVRIHKTVSLTLLDEGRGEAATLGWTGVYATLSPEPNIRFDSATEVRPLFATADGFTDWTDGQRFVSGWIGSRLPRGFAVRKVEPRRERVPIRIEAGGNLVAVNGLGAEIRQLWVADQSSAIWSASNVPAGKEVVLTRTNKTAGAFDDPAHLFAEPTAWSSYQARIAADPFGVLRPGSYVAVLERSPFVEAAVEKPTTYSSAAVVIGVPKGFGDAR